MTQNDIVQKLWNLCDVLRDDGINYSDYVTELVLLLFIKMEYENTQAGLLNAHALPEGARWPDLTGRSGLSLLNYYKQMLLDLSKSSDRLIAAIYADAQTRLREPRHLEQLIRDLDRIDWFSAQKDGLGDLYEGLLEKNANETKSGAGQYFTPRALINAMVRCLRPRLGETIQDPAAGTAGFLVAADQYLRGQTHNYLTLSARQHDFQKLKAFVGIELVPGTRRLALMNCLLHGMEGDDEGVVHLGNALGEAGKALPRADVILANPPFGTAKGGRGQHYPRRPHLPHQQQAARLSAAYLPRAQARRPRRRGAARQRAVRGGAGHRDPPRPDGEVPPAHPPAVAHRHLLRPGREDQRALLHPRHRREPPPGRGLHR